LIKNIILVGSGSHVKKKIIPALKKKKIKIIKTFTSRDKLNEISNSNFNIKNLIYYISTPPKTHYLIAKALLKKKKNLIIEKPALLKIKDFKIIKKLVISNKKNIFIENLMYQFSKIFQKFHNYWEKNKKKVKKIEINFLIPSFFKIGFRSMSKDKYIILYDIGIYPVSLLNFLQINIKKIITISKYNKNKKMCHLKIFMKSSNLNLVINIGEEKKYYNNIILTNIDGSKIYFDKIFSGVATSKKILYYDKKKVLYKKIKFNDLNCFEKLFCFKSSYLKSLKFDSLKLLEKNLILLNKIKLKI